MALKPDTVRGLETFESTVQAPPELGRYWRSYPVAPETLDQEAVICPVPQDPADNDGVDGCDGAQTFGAVALANELCDPAPAPLTARTLNE